MKLTTKLTALMLLSTMTFATVAKSEEIVIPVISKPAVLQEGTQRELTVAQIAELLPWAKDSKVFLADLLDSTQGLSNTDKLDRLIEGMKYVVGESAPKNSELLMRYAINRGLVLNEILSQESSSEEVGSIDAKVRVVVSSIKMAIKYYDIDMATLSKKSSTPFVTFGLDYFNFLNELNKSIFDATAQYNIQKAALEWLQWDLYRDLNNTSYAPQILKINNAVKTLPKTKLSDKQSLTYIRQMKMVALNLNVESIRQEAAKRDLPVVDKSTTSVPKNNSNGFRVGDIVNTNARTNGVITKIFSDGIIVVTVDGNNSNYYKEQLERPLTCIEDFCVNQTVVTNDRETGVIALVFSNKLVQILINGKKKNYYTTQISKPITCTTDGFCVNQIVATKDYSTGIITQVFPDNVVTISINDLDHNYYTAQIDVPIKCIKDFCIEDIVDTQDHETGKILQVFKNGMTVVLINGENKNYYTTQLLK
jgi:hypothetical protein